MMRFSFIFWIFPGHRFLVHLNILPVTFFSRWYGIVLAFGFIGGYLGFNWNLVSMSLIVQLVLNSLLNLDNILRFSCLLGSVRCCVVDVQYRAGNSPSQFMRNKIMKAFLLLTGRVRFFLISFFPLRRYFFRKIFSLLWLTYAYL